jgi:hypothetical protein
MVSRVEESQPAPAPILITAFNRPDRLARLLASLQADAPPVVRIAIDGPRNSDDRAGVEETRRIATTVGWECDLEVWARDTNAGIATAIPEAVSRALSEFDRVFVIEDDVSVGPQAYEFMCRALDQWETEPTIYSVSAYNMVPVDQLSRPDDPARLSRVMSSYAWGTWRDRWTVYDPEMTWFAKQSISDLTTFFGSRVVAMRWRQHHRMVASGLVDSWAYRWVMSTWGHGGFSVVPNRTLISYFGANDGTHTLRRRRWAELNLQPINVENLACQSTHLDLTAESFFHRVNQRCTIPNVIIGRIEGRALQFHRHRTK